MIRAAVLCMLATGAAAEDGCDVPYKVDSMLVQKYGEARLVTLRGRVDRVVLAVARRVYMDNRQA